MDEIVKKLTRVGWRLRKGVQKLHPVTAAQKQTLRAALAAQLKETQAGGKNQEIPKTQPKKDREQKQTRSKGPSHGH